jgi:predicted transcriptional regulator
MATSEDNEILAELVAIKKLLVFALLRQPGSVSTQYDIAGALGISQAQVSRMFAKPVK